VSEDRPGRTRSRPSPVVEARIVAGIADVAREHLGWQGEIRREQRLVETMRLDSLRLLTLVVEIENRFRVILDEVDALGHGAIETVGDLIDAIGRKVEPAADDAE
jgi:acyl carrier protein